MRIEKCKKDVENKYLISIINNFKNQYFSSMIEDYMINEFEEERESYRNILMMYGIINDCNDLINKMYSFSTLNKKNILKINDEEFHTAVLYLIYLENKRINYDLQENLKNVILKKISLFGRFINKNKVIKEYNKTIIIKRLILNSCKIQRKIQILFNNKIEKLNASLDRIYYTEFLNRNCMMIEIVEQKYLMNLFEIKEKNYYKNKCLFNKEKIELLKNRNLRNTDFKNEYLKRVFENIDKEEKIIEYVLLIISIGLPILIFLPR